MAKTYKIKGNAIEVTFSVPTKEFQSLLLFIKSIVGRKWLPAEKKWSIPATEANIALLQSKGFTDPTGDNFSPVIRDIPKPVIAPIDVSKLDSRLHPYQIEGVGFLEARGGSGVLAWEVGCGKSLGAISYTLLHDDHPALIICPSAVKTNWERECKKWANKKAVRLYGTKAGKIPKAPFVIINYDILGNPKDESSWSYYLTNYGFKLIILDECHYLKNSNAKRTKAFLHIVKNISKRIFLSGTLVKNRTSDLFVPLHCLDPKSFPNEYKFLHRYCDPKHNGFSWTFKGLTNENELLYYMSPLIHSVKKRDVLKDLPKRQTFTIPMEVDNSAKKQYDRASEKFMEWVLSTEKKKGADGKAHMETLRAFAFQMKRDSLISWIDDFLQGEEKLIVFLVHIAAIDDLATVFKDAIVIDGRATKDRQLLVDMFTNDSSKKLLIGQIDACGTGLNLQVASNVVIAELPYSLSSIEQATGRIDRLGQKAETVTTWIPFAPETIEQDIALLLEEKREITDTLLNKGVKTDIFGMDIQDVIVSMCLKKNKKST